MKVTLTHDGKSVELDLTAEQMTALGLKEEKKKTGYERVEERFSYSYEVSDGRVYMDSDSRTTFDDMRFQTANYYNTASLGEANARADRLMRQLRRFAAENGGIPSVKDWESCEETKYSIAYCHADCINVVSRLYVDHWIRTRQQGVAYFNSEDACNKAIEKFHDELIWYFTEYEAMLR